MPDLTTSGRAARRGTADTTPSTSARVYDSGRPGHTPPGGCTMKPTTDTRRGFIKTTTAAAAAFTIVPRHVLGGPASSPRATRSTSRSSAPAARGGPTRAPSSRRTTARSSRSPIPAEEWDLSHVVLRRQVGPRPGEGGSREALRRARRRTSSARCTKTSASCSRRRRRSTRS